MIQKVHAIPASARFMIVGRRQQAVVRVASKCKWSPGKPSGGSFQEVGILSRNQGSIGTKPDHLVAFPEVSSLDIPFSWQSFVPPLVWMPPPRNISFS